eukprot:5370659-Amphidinium_carterae.2
MFCFKLQSRTVRNSHDPKHVQTATLYERIISCTGWHGVWLDGRVRTNVPSAESTFEADSRTMRLNGERFKER